MNETQNSNEQQQWNRARSEQATDPTRRRAQLGESRANPGGVAVTGFAGTSAEASLKISLNREVSLNLGTQRRELLLPL